MKHRIVKIVAGLGMLASAPLALATETYELSARQLDQVLAAGAIPYRSISSLKSVGAAALASTTVVSTPKGTASADVSITANVGLATTGFTKSISFGVVR